MKRYGTQQNTKDPKSKENKLNKGQQKGIDDFMKSELQKV